jgi:VanZ family protein
MTGFAAHLLATALPLAALATTAAWTSFAIVRLHGTREHARRAATRALLAAYALGLAWWTILLANPAQTAERHVNLVPFREIARSLSVLETRYGLLNLWGNVVAFVPVGVFGLLALRRGSRRAWLIALGAGTALSVVLEVAQYGVGRSADVDDVILNGIGVGLGVALAAIARFAAPAQSAAQRRRRWSARGRPGDQDTGADDRGFAGREPKRPRRGDAPRRVRGGRDQPHRAPQEPCGPKRRRLELWALPPSPWSRTRPRH